ncbi:MAG: YHS domain-containing protein [Chlorobia bacterium]|nr:YHS domain-containing protein [Fimbriimonadaceae bacterium]
MKKIALSLVVGALAVGAFAQAKPKAPTELACAVMPSHKVKIADATKTKMFADYKGRRYFFCCAGCPAAFKATPAKYAKKELSIPTPKSKKA